MTNQEREQGVQQVLTDLSKYEAVNQCETLEDLAECIAKFAAPSGEIEGRERKFDAQKMMNYCKNYRNLYGHAPNVLTRKWGIRQQALYIIHTYPEENP